MKQPSGKKISSEPNNAWFESQCTNWKLSLSVSERSCDEGFWTEATAAASESRPIEKNSWHERDQGRSNWIKLRIVKTTTKIFKLIFISELILQTKVNAFSKLYTLKMICGYTSWADWLKQFKKSHNFQYFVFVIATSLIIDFNLVWSKTSVLGFTWIE